MPCSAADLTSQICYALRVILAHLRSKYESCGSTTSVLDPIFDVLRKPTPRKARREGRMHKANPPACFRPPTKDIDDVCDDEVPTVVTKYYDGASNTGKMLMCDGAIILSDTIELGPNGFLRAKRLRDGRILELAVPSVVMDKSEDAPSPPVSKPRSTRGLRGEGRARLDEGSEDGRTSARGLRSRDGD